VPDGLLLRAGGPGIPRVATLHFGNMSRVYASIHGASDEVFVRIDFLRSYVHTCLLCHYHFVSLIIAHQLFLVDVLACDTGIE
jgi:hypothetical protein